LSIEPGSRTETRLWNTTPASEWLSAFPVGNGRIGGMVFGGIGHERIGLNHESLWRGVTRDRTTQPVADRLPEIREAFFSGDMARGAELAESILGGHERRIMPYQPVGDLLIGMPGEQADPESYLRELDLVSGIATTSWSTAIHTVRRQVFVSADHQALVVLIESDTPGSLDLEVSLTRRTSDEHPGKPTSNWVNPDEAQLTTWSRGHRAGLVGLFPEGISFATELRVIADGAEISAPNPAESHVIVHSATVVSILLGIGVKTESHLMNQRDAIASHLDAVPINTERLLLDHLAEHVGAMKRVTLALPRSPGSDLPLTERLDRLRAGKDDPGLVVLYFAFGRYLLYSSSRRCQHPANLQGIWSQELSPAWQCDFHLNINLQMNYWPALSTNLAECTPPLIAFIDRFAPSAREAARNLYGAEGTFLPHATDVWGRATPEAPVCDVWQGAASWLAQHLWWEWEFGQDRAFLERHVYPWIRECAEFWRTFLVPEARKDHPLAGKLVSVPSNSPENSYEWNGHRLRYGIGATMDLLLARETLEHAITASELLDVDEAQRTLWRNTLRQLAPLQVGKHGQLQEYVDDWDEPEPAHRHVSHLYGVFPGHDNVVASDDNIRQAARTSLDRRLAHGGGHTGWSRAWVAALWAHFREGDLAHEHLDELIRQFATDALLDLHPPRIFQIDGNFGGTAAVAEMLLQSHDGFIHLLPALTRAWPEGHVSGLSARGQITVEITWSNGAIRLARLHTKSAGQIRVSMPVDRPWSVTSTAVAPHPGPWGAVEFATAGAAQDSVEFDQAGQTLRWTGLPDTVYQIQPS
jgi:alpha-L-fucosidase 2